MALAAQFEFAMLFHDFRGIGLQNWIRVVADLLTGVVHQQGFRTPRARAAVVIEKLPDARPIRHRPWARWRQLKARVEWVCPQSGEIRDGCRACHTAAR